MLDSTVLAFDPGPTSTGFAVVATVAVGNVRRHTYVDGGQCSSTPEGFAAVLEAFPGVRVAIEQVAGYAYEQARSAQLIATARVGGLLEGLARSDGRAVQTIAAGQWRKSLCGRSSADDATIKRAVGVFVVGLPKRTNVHVRDALGLAVVASWVTRRAA